MEIQAHRWWIVMLWSGLLGAALYGTGLIIGLLSLQQADPTVLDGVCAALLATGAAGSLLVSSSVIEDDEVAVRLRLQWGLLLALNPLLQLGVLWGAGAL